MDGEQPVKSKWEQTKPSGRTGGCKGRGEEEDVRLAENDHGQGEHVQEHGQCSRGARIGVAEEEVGLTH